jgi:hypothetical protein
MQFHIFNCMQVYFTSADEVAQENLAMTRANINNTPESRSLFKKLRRIVEANPLLKLFKASYEVFAQGTKNFRLVFTHGRDNRPPDQHARKFNLPQVGTAQQNSEVAGVYHIDGDADAGQRSIVVHHRAEFCRDGKEKLTELQSTFRLRVPLCYPLLFLFGEEGPISLHFTIAFQHEYKLTAHELFFSLSPKAGATMG